MMTFIVAPTTSSAAPSQCNSLLCSLTGPETYRAKAAAATTAYGKASLLFAIACSTLLFQDCCISSASCNTTHHQAGPYADQARAHKGCVWSSPSSWKPLDAAQAGCERNHCCYTGPTSLCCGAAMFASETAAGAAVCVIRQAFCDVVFCAENGSQILECSASNLNSSKGRALDLYKIAAFALIHIAFYLDGRLCSLCSRQEAIETPSTTRFLCPVHVTLQAGVCLLPCCALSKGWLAVSSSFLHVSCLLQGLALVPCPAVLAGSCLAPCPACSAA